MNIGGLGMKVIRLRDGRYVKAGWIYKSPLLREMQEMKQFEIERENELTELKTGRHESFLDGSRREW